MTIGQAVRQTVDLAASVLLARRLSARESWTRAELLAHQRRSFMAMVRHAREASAFYRDLYRGIDLDGEIASTRLPITNKRLLMDNFEKVVTDPRLRRDDALRHLAGATSDELLLGEYRVVATAGTSGLRGIFVYDRAAWRMVMANTFRWQRMIGIGPRLTRRLRIGSIGADSPMHRTSRIRLTGDVGLFRLLHLRATEPVAQLVAALAAFRPDAILPYPSVAALLAREQLAGRLAIAPRVIATHSEVLTPEMARLMERAWGCKPFNHYGLTEEPHVGTDCDLHAGIHLLEDTAMIEVVDDDYRPVPDGGMGTRYLLTNL